MTAATAPRRPGDRAPADECGHHPDPASAPPPACWVATATHRARLELAFAVLRRYGIAAVPAVDEDPGSAHRHLAAAVARVFPDGAGSYVFWTADDDARCLDGAGDLAADLPLHHPPHVSAAVAAALGQVGLDPRDSADGGGTVVPVGTRPREGR